MKTRHFTVYTTLIFALPIVIGVNDRAFGQAEINSNKRPTLPLSRVISESGWKIPAAKRSRTQKPQSRIIDGVSVDFALLVPRNPIIDFIDYYIIANGELRLLNEKRRIDGMSAMSVKGRTFGYMIDSSPYHGPDSNTSAVFIPVYFVDRDGDGKFEERIVTRSILLLPEWVKR
jgi:hypothetical protein